MPRYGRTSDLARAQVKGEHLAVLADPRDQLSVRGEARVAEHQWQVALGKETVGRCVDGSPVEPRVVPDVCESHRTVSFRSAYWATVRPPGPRRYGPQARVEVADVPEF